MLIGALHLSKSLLFWYIYLSSLVISLNSWSISAADAIVVVLLLLIVLLLSLLKVGMVDYASSNSC